MIKLIRDLETGKDFSTISGWTNEKTIIRLIPFWYWLPKITKSKKVITWLRFQLVLPYK